MLEKSKFKLNATSAHLHGYSSDICRTFFPPFLEKPVDRKNLSSGLKKKLDVSFLSPLYECRTVS